MMSCVSWMLPVVMFGIGARVVATAEPVATLSEMPVTGLVMSWWVYVPVPLIVGRYCASAMRVCASACST